MDAEAQPDHPGKQCHEVHPGVPHVRITPDPVPVLPGEPGPLRPLDPQPLPSVLSSLQAPAGPAALDWSRFDEYASRALEFAGDAVTKADQVSGDHGTSPEFLAHESRQEAARICADLAVAASPYSLGAPPRIETSMMDLGVHE